MPATLLKKRLWHRYFPVNFAKFLRIPFVSIFHFSGSPCKQSIGVQTGYLETGDIKTSSSQPNFTATDPWCPATVDDKQFMAVDLGEDFSISKIATQGKLDDKDRYITLYGLQYSSDAKKWTDYKDIFGNAVSSSSRPYKHVMCTPR